MSYVWRQQHQFNFLAVYLIEVKDDDLHVGGHKDISIPFLEHGLHKLHANAILVFQDPVCFNAVHVASICFVIRFLLVLTHDILKVCHIHV